MISVYLLLDLFSHDFSSIDYCDSMEVVLDFLSIQIVYVILAVIIAFNCFYIGCSSNKCNPGSIFKFIVPAFALFFPNYFIAIIADPTA